MDIKPILYEICYTTDFRGNVGVTHRWNFVLIFTPSFSEYTFFAMIKNMHTVCYTSSIILDIKVNLESYSKISLVLFHCIQDAQNLNKEIDNIEVQVDRGQNVFLRRQLMHQHVSVKHNESRKQQSSSNGIH